MEPAIIEEVEPEGLTEFDDTYEKAVQAIPQRIRIVIEKLAFQIKTQGLTLEEACLIKNVDTDWLERVMTEYPIVARIFAKKDLEYRVALMGPINKRAKQDEKMAMFLLEQRTPKQRKNARHQDDDTSDDMIALAISHIRENGDSTPLVPPTQNTTRSAAAIVISHPKRVDQLMKKISNILPH